MRTHQLHPSITQCKALEDEKIPPQISNELIFELWYCVIELPEYHVRFGAGH